MPPREEKARKGRKGAAPRGDPSLLGATIQGRYHLVRLLGDGGMGAVYKAADQVLRRFVAIKLLHPSTAENPAAVERFVREARSAAAIGHPNIIDILDFGYEKKRPFLVMEYLRGRSLSEAIAEEGKLSIQRACSIATHALAGLSAAHDRGILHRDLKPANLMLIALLGDRDFVKLCDFGFAALVVPTVRIDGGKSLTPARTLVGTPAYAAPERLRGDDRRDPRLDVYSIGVVLFEMLAGRRPFDAPTFRELARKVRNEPPPPLRSLRPDIPRGLERAVRKALAKRREDRWKDAEEFAAALVPFGGRVIPHLDECPSDSFTMDLLRIRARETQQQNAISPSEAEQILAIQAKHRKERDEQRARPERRAAPRRPKPRRPSPSPPARRRSPPPAPPMQAAPIASSFSIEIEVADESESVSSYDAIPPPPRAPQAPERPKFHEAGEEPTFAPGPRAGPMADADADATLMGAAPLFGEPTLTSRVEFPSDPPPAGPPTPRAPAPEGVLEDDPERAPRDADATAIMDPRTFRGSVSLAVLRFVSRRFGERALNDLLRNLPPLARLTFEEGITEEGWVPYEAHNSLVQSVDARLGRDDLHLVVQCGRATAEANFDLMRAIQPPSPPPELLLAEMPRIVSELSHGLELKAERVGRGYGRLELDEHGESSLTSCVFLIGFLDRSLDRFGASDVEVNLISTPALGDAKCVYEISWIS